MNEVHSFHKLAKVKGEIHYTEYSHGKGDPISWSHFLVNKGEYLHRMLVVDNDSSEEV